MYAKYLDGYKITREGSVISYKQTSCGKVLKPGIDFNGYAHVILNGKTITIHRLVASIYCDGFIPGYEVNHKDGNKLNNNCENLEWVTSSQNIQHGCMNIVNKRSKLERGDVIKILDLYLLWKTGGDRRYTSPKLAKLFGVSKVTIGNIINGKRYLYWTRDHDIFSFLH